MCLWKSGLSAIGISPQKSILMALRLFVNSMQPVFMKPMIPFWRTPKIWTWRWYGFAKSALVATTLTATFLNLKRFVHIVTRSSMIPSRCPASMRAARPSFAQWIAWQIILYCVTLEVRENSTKSNSHLFLGGILFSLGGQCYHNCEWRVLLSYDGLYLIR